MSGRPHETPLVDAWLTELKSFLKPRGRKVQLARRLALGDASKTRQFQNQIARWLRGEEQPSAETLLAVEQWKAAPRLAKGKYPPGEE